MNKHYPSINSDPNFPEIEEQVLKFWQENDTFKKSIENRPLDNHFVFYDGPPFANGLPHYGHLLTGFIKDVYARYQTMRGRRVERRFGWDCHGLPAEMATEKELGISGRSAIEEFGVDKFNNHCRKSVMKFASEWEQYVTRQARWVDFHNDYKTMDTSFMESVLWAFKALYDRGLIYESMRVVPYSWACETPLSNFETRMDNSYREKSSKTVTVGFELCTKPEVIVEDAEKYYLLVWTTTPWTLPSNLSLAVGENILYSIVSVNNNIYIFSKSYLASFKDHCEKNNISYIEYKETIFGKDLIGLQYKPLFNYFAQTPNAFKVLSADFVLDTEGTGIVHIAPGFGEDDFNLCKQHNIPVVCPIDDGGKFTAEVTDFYGLQVFAANDDIIKHLKNQGNWFKTEQYLHNYPHCWRTDTPLIYRALSSWYVKVTEIKQRMLELNQQVNWVPEHIKNGQFGKWLEGSIDWSISRNRFWGTPIPIWKSTDPKYPRIDVYGSISELEHDFNVSITDLHLPFINQLTRPNPDDPTGKSMMKRIPDVFDCWFESGSMPYAQVHYPFENKEWFENNFPADFITEYVAQTRGWFYTLFVLSTALFDKPPFKNCVCHGVVLDIQGQKLSKRLNNYQPPLEVFNKFGADSLRFLMLSGSIVQGGDLLLDKDGNMLQDILRVVIKPIWNSYHFFTMYANVDGIKATISKNFNNIMDKYIIAKCTQAVLQIYNYMKQYNTQNACKILVDFFETMNNWYIRRSRVRFWSEGINQDKVDAYNTLYTVFYYILRAAAPLLPLITESIWQGLKYSEDSIHLTDFPEVVENDIDNDLIKQMDFVRDICNAGLSVRNTHNIRIRQPLKGLYIYHNKYSTLPIMYQDIIKDELNIKTIEFIDDIKQIATTDLKLNFNLLGKRLSSQTKSLIQYAKNKQWRVLENSQLILGEDIVIEENEYEFILKPNSKFSCVFDNNHGVVMLDTELSDDLIVEGLARDIVRFIQQTRKDLDLNITDRIEVVVQTEDKLLQNAVLQWQDYIKEQTLSLDLSTTSVLNDHYDYLKSTIDNKDITIFIKRAKNKDK